MQVYLDGDAVTLDKRMVLGSGGEGTVYKVTFKGGKYALKVYEKPTRERSLKLLTFEKLSPKFPDRVIAPQTLALDGKGLAVGFTMPILTGTFEEIASLSNKKYRTSFGITTKDIGQIFLDGISTLNDVHQRGFVVGDLNDLNELFQEHKMLWIDVDSWQFGGFICPVATETFVDPKLYDVDFGARPAFTPGNDWYSYAVMLFKSLLLVHPFGGTHKTLNRITYRAKNKITVFDKSVIYPKVGLSPDILTDDLHEIFDRYFTKDFRGNFPEKLLHEYIDGLVPCTSCGTYFPSRRGTCPVCSAKMILVIQKPISSTKNLEVTEILRVNGQILYVRVIGDEVRVLANEAGRVKLYVKRPNLTPSVSALFENIPGAKFEMTADHLFVNEPGSSQILVYKVDSGKPIGKMVTSTFVPTRKAAFRASDDHYFRIEGDNLLYGEIDGKGLNESVLRQIMEGLSWFWVDPHAESPSVFGFFQVMRQQMYWMIKDGNYFDVSIPQLEPGENVIDISAKVSSRGTYLIRKTQQKGVTFMRQDLIDAGGKVIFVNRVEESKHPNPSVHGQAYTFGVVLHPTDDGIMQEEVAKGVTNIFADSKGHVDGGDTLQRYENSLLAIKQDRVLQISLKRS